MKWPRITSRQKQRPIPKSLNSHSPVDYYRVNIYLPLFDNVLEDSSCRFLSEENKNIISLMQLIPSYINKMKRKYFTEYFKTISEIMIGSYTFFRDVSKNIIENELDIWFIKWRRHKVNILLNVFLIC